MILSTHGIIGSQIQQFDLDYLAILNYATTQGYTLPSSPQRNKQNKLLVDLKAAGVWSKLDTLSVFATDGNSDFALIDWKRLSQYTAINSPTFTTNQGFKGNGNSSYIDTNFNPSTSGVNYTLNNASRSAWVFDAISGRIIDGLTAGSTNDFATAISNQMRINCSVAPLSVSVNLEGNGLKNINRTSSLNVSVFNNTTQTNGTSSSTLINNNTQWILRRGASYSNNGISFYAMGASLESENTAFYNALNTYVTSL
jgi:hypothetical protein